MQNVTFRCGHCNSLMAVTPADVGKQVRCPTCQGVVVAPSPPAPAPTVTAPPPPVSVPVPSPPVPPSFEISAPVEHESIFAPELPNDDLFGDEPAVRVEMPPEPPRPAPAPSFTLDPPAPPVESAHDHVFENHTSLPAAVPTTESDESSQQVERVPPSLWEADGSTTDTSNATSSFTPTVRRPSGGWSIPLLIVPLVSYAVLATILLFIVWKENQRLKFDRPHPLEAVPDVEGDNPGVKKPGGRVQIEYPKPEQDLPAHLKTTIGKKITIGAIEFEPLKVTKERIWVETKGSDTEQEINESLVLYFKVTNISSNQTFAPMDAFFYRCSPAQDRSLDEIEPYTRLEIGDSKWIGGPAQYRRKGSTQARESVRDQNVTTVLEPGQSMTSFVCNDPRKGNLNRSLSRHKGDMLWRVQLRRGLVEFESPYKGNRTVAACVVLGVTFNSGQISGR